jgi:DNA helicase-2/ATP-dependent DNA helicase PcrA
MSDPVKQLSHDEKIALVKERLGMLNRDLSEEQLDFILHPIKTPCYLKACPGSGKTEVVGIKAAYDIKEWEDKFAGVAVLSFTKNAAKEISERIKKYGGSSATQHPHFIGTIDSWLHGYLLHPLGHKSTNYKGKLNDKSYRLIDNEEKYDFLTSFKTDIYINNKLHQSIWANDYYFECGTPPALQSQSRYLNLETVTADVKTTLQNNKKKFLGAGLSTYADAEFLCYYLLKNNANILNLFVKRFPFLIIDECQDLSNNQLEILHLLVEKGTIVHFIGDNNQSIYEFKKVYTEKITEFITNNNLEQKQLTQNYRSNQHVVNICLELEKLNTGQSLGSVIGKEPLLFEKNCFVWEYEKDQMTQLPQKFIDFIKDKNKSLTNAGVTLSLGKSAVLARSHATLSEFRPQSNRDFSKTQLFASAINIWNVDKRSGKDMQNSLQQLGKALCLTLYNGNGNHQQQYCPELFSQIEWRSLLFEFISAASLPANNLYPFATSNWSIWAGNFKKFLEAYWSNLPDTGKELADIKKVIKAPNKQAASQVVDGIKQSITTISNPVRFTTIHDVKGETLDAVLLVSSPNNAGQKTGRHYEDWIGLSDDKEHIRFGYVASSRPKHLLIWAIPKTANNTNLAKMEAMGFTLESFGLFENL